MSIRGHQPLPGVFIVDGVFIFDRDQVVYASRAMGGVPIRRWHPPTLSARRQVRRRTCTQRCPRSRHHYRSTPARGDPDPDADHPRSIRTQEVAVSNPALAGVVPS